MQQMNINTYPIHRALQLAVALECRASHHSMEHLGTVHDDKGAVAGGNESQHTSTRRRTFGGAGSIGASLSPAM